MNNPIVPDSQKQLNTTADNFIEEIDSVHDRFRSWAKSLRYRDYCALATYLYWMKPDISVPEIADMIGYSPANKLNEIVDKQYPVPVLCACCGQYEKVHYNSRKIQKFHNNERFVFQIIHDPEKWALNRQSYIGGIRVYIDDSFSLDMTVRVGITHNSICDFCYDSISSELLEMKTLREKEVERERRLPYKEYLQSEHWRDFRQGILMLASYRCQICNQESFNDRGSGLHVHHRTYDNLGNESERDVIVLCSACHTTFHYSGKLAR